MAGGPQMPPGAHPAASGSPGSWARPAPGRGAAHHPKTMLHTLRGAQSVARWSWCPGGALGLSAGTQLPFISPTSEGDPGAGLREGPPGGGGESGTGGAERVERAVMKCN